MLGHSGNWRTSVFHNKDGKGTSGTEFQEYLQSKYTVAFKQYIDEALYKEFREVGHERLLNIRGG